VTNSATLRMLFHSRVSGIAVPRSHFFLRYH